MHFSVDMTRASKVMFVMLSWHYRGHKILCRRNDDKYSNQHWPTTVCGAQLQIHASECQLHDWSFELPFTICFNRSVSTRVHDSGECWFVPASTDKVWRATMLNTMYNKNYKQKLINYLLNTLNSWESKAQISWSPIVTNESGALVLHPHYLWKVSMKVKVWPRPLNSNVRVMVTIIDGAKIFI